MTEPIIVSGGTFSHCSSCEAQVDSWKIETFHFSAKRQLEPYDRHVRFSEGWLHLCQECAEQLREADLRRWDVDI